MLNPPLPFEPDVKELRDNTSHNSSSSLGQIWQGTKEFFSRKDRRESAPIAKGFVRNNVDNDTTTLSFVFDENVWKNLQNIIPGELWDEVHRDLKWFQDEYAKGKNSQYYAKASRENTATIDAFGRYLAKKKYATKILLPEIIEFLKKIYVR